MTIVMVSCNGTANQSATAGNTEQTPLRLAEFSADSCRAMVVKQLAFGPRVPGTDSHTACGDFLAATLQHLGADTVIEQRATLTNPINRRPMPVRNILARFNTAANRHILLLAHWDTRPVADNDPNEANRQTPIPGANDGASGVAVLLEIARLLGETPAAIGVDILLVDAEDSGVEDNDESWGLGTQYFTAHLPYDETSRPSYGILLDMVGDGNARFYREYFSEHYARSVNDRIQAIAAMSGFTDLFIDKIGGAVTDDHTFLNRIGIPTADIIDCNNAETSTFPASWHTMADDLPAINTSTLYAVGQTLANIIYSERN